MRTVCALDFFVLLRSIETCSVVDSLTAKHQLTIGFCSDFLIAIFSSSSFPFTIRYKPHCSSFFASSIVSHLLMNEEILCVWWSASWKFHEIHCRCRRWQRSKRWKTINLKLKCILIHNFVAFEKPQYFWCSLRRGKDQKYMKNHQIDFNWSNRVNGITSLWTPSQPFDKWKINSMNFEWSRRRRNDDFLFCSYLVAPIKRFVYIHRLSLPHTIVYARSCIDRIRRVDIFYSFIRRSVRFAFNLCNHFDVSFWKSFKNCVFFFVSSVRSKSNKNKLEFLSIRKKMICNWIECYGGRSIHAILFPIKNTAFSRQISIASNSHFTMSHFNGSFPYIWIDSVVA